MAKKHAGGRRRRWPIEAVREGGAAGRELLRRLNRAARTMFSDPRDAEEAANDAYQQIHEKQSHISRARNPQSYINAVIFNAFRTYARRQKHGKEPDPVDLQQHDEAVDLFGRASIDPLEAVEDSLLAKHAMEIVERLRGEGRLLPRDAQVFELWCMRRPGDEIQSTTGMSKAVHHRAVCRVGIKILKELGDMDGER